MLTHPTAVLYTDDLEPITVLELPALAREILEEQGRVTLHVPEPPAWLPEGGPVSAYVPPRTVRIRAELLRRGARRHLMLFTEDDEAALLLRAAFLPGQRRELQSRERDAFAAGVLRALRELSR